MGDTVTKECVPDHKVYKPQGAGFWEDADTYVKKAYNKYTAEHGVQSVKEAVTFWEDARYYVEKAYNEDFAKFVKYTAEHGVQSVKEAVTFWEDASYDVKKAY